MVAAMAPIGAPLRSTLRRSREAGSTPSRATEKIVRAVSAWAAMPQARNAKSTTAANGLADQVPKELTTAVETGSMSRPATMSAGFGCASSAATALSMTTAATLSSANQSARGTWRAAPLVSSEAPTHASKPMNTQPPTARAASMPAPTDPPESSSAPRVSVRMEMGWVRKTSRSATPIPTDATISAAMPARITRPRTSIPSAPTVPQTRTRTIPAATIAFGVGAIPTRASAQGAPR